MARLAWLGVLLCYCQALSANGLVTDGSVGAAKTLTGRYVVVPQSLGSTIGNNLFHSFSDFSIKSGQTVEFTGSAALKNVITRVTGLERTMINGKLASSIPNADFYLINPNGIIFGEQAVLDVPGSFHATTADRLTFNDGKAFNAELNNTSQLSSAKPSAFGFLGTSAVNNGLIALKGAQLRVNDDQKLDFVAGNVHIASTKEQDSVLVASAGELRFVAMRGENTVAVTDSTQSLPLPKQVPTSDNAGNINIDGTKGPTFLNLFTAGNGAGRLSFWSNTINLLNTRALVANLGDLSASLDKGIYINASYLELINSLMISDPISAGNGANINIAVKALNVLGQSYLSSTTHGTGAAGDIKIRAENIKIIGDGMNAGGVFSAVDKGATGQAGNIIIDTSRLTLSHGGELSSSTLNGDAGNISIKADKLSIDGSDSHVVTGISTSSFPDSQGNAGLIIIKANQIKILNTGTISADSYGAGDAGQINIHAKSLLIDGQNSPIATGITSNVTQGLSSEGTGKITVTAAKINVIDMGVISSSTLSNADAGQIAIKANKLYLSGGGSIASVTTDGSSGNAGQITIEANDTRIIDRATIRSDSLGLGNAGQVAVKTQHLVVDGQNAENVTGITSSAYAGRPNNVSGVVSVIADDINIMNGGEISSSTGGKANAGKVNVESNRLSIDGASSMISSSAGSNSLGNAGVVTVKSGQLTIKNGGAINSITRSVGDAGQVNVQANQLDIVGVIDFQTGIFSNADKNSQGNAGKIDVDVGDIKIVNTATISSDTKGQGNAGQVSVMAKSLVIDGQHADFATGITSDAELKNSQAHAGSVSVTATDVKIIRGGQISSTSWSKGDAGRVDIYADNLILAGNHTLISSATSAQSEGDAGTIKLDTQHLSVLDGASIVSSSLGTGDAGGIVVQANTLLLSSNHQNDFTGFFSTKGVNASGTNGNISIMVDNWMKLNRGFIATVSESLVSPEASTAFGTIHITAPNIVANQSLISTSTNLDHGGEIVVNSNDLLWLKNSGLVTTVFNYTGNGGDIRVNANNLVMDMAALQANAQLGNGGAITVNARALIPSGNSLLLGGQSVLWAPSIFGFNVIQAASESGVSGEINIASPQLNLSGVLANLGNPIFDSEKLTYDACNSVSESSLSSLGQGGLVSEATELPY